MTMRFLVIAVGLSLLSVPCPARPDSVTATKPALTALVVTPDETGYVVGSQAGVQLHPFSGGMPKRLATQLEQVHALSFSPDGKTLAVAGGSPAVTGVVELWTWPVCKLLGRLEGHDDLVYDIAWLPAGTALATASADRTVRLWDIPRRAATQTLTGHSGPVLALAAAPDGTLLCSGSADHTIRVWDPATGKLLRVLNNHLGPVYGLAFQPGKQDGPLSLASAGGDSTVRLWQPAIGRMVRIIRHPAPVFALTWTPRGTHLVSGAKDGHVRLIDSAGAVVLRETALSAGWIVSLAIASQKERILAGDSRGQFLLCETRR